MGTITMKTLLFCYRLPEVPPDTPETNPIMRVHDYPQFSQLSPDLALTGCAKLAIEFDVELGKHVEKLKGWLDTIIVMVIITQVQSFSWLLLTKALHF